MVVGEMPDPVDMLVVGGGPGGYAAALSAARAGRDVVLVDSLGDAGLGGVCVNVGCIPSKALIEMANTVHALGGWATRGISTGSAPRVDMGAFQTWKSDVVSGLNDGVKQLLTSAGVEVRQGHFRFTRADQGAIEHWNGPPTHIQFTSCVLATGSRPATLPHLSPAGTRILDSSDVLALRDLPRRIAVIGGGYIGVELGTTLLKLGAHVVMVEAADRLLPTLPVEVGAPVQRRLSQLGMDVRTSSQVCAGHGTHLRLSTAEGEKQLEVDCVVVAVGRRPNTDDLGLDKLGVETDERGLLGVGPNLLVTRRVAAIGDITPGPALAHKASAEALVAVEVLSGRPAAFDPATIPAVVFSDPEIAVTGVTCEEAERRGINASVAAFPVAASGRARTLHEKTGFTQLVYAAEGGVVIGAQLVGPHASELVAEATLAIEMGANLVDVAQTVHPHPTMGETLMEAARRGLGHLEQVQPQHGSAR